MRKATFSATFWRFVGDAKSKSCENIWHLVSRATTESPDVIVTLRTLRSCEQRLMHTDKYRQSQARTFVGTSSRGGTADNLLMTATPRQLRVQRERSASVSRCVFVRSIYTLNKVQSPLESSCIV